MLKEMVDKELKKKAAPLELEAHVKNIKSADRVQMHIGIIALRKILSIGT